MFPLEISKFNEIFSGAQFAIYAVMSVLNAVLLLYASMKFLLVLQQGGYYYKRYFKWLSNKETPYLSRLMLLCLMGFMFFAVLATCFIPVFGNAVSSFIGFVSYALFTLLYIKSEKSVNVKIPLKKTKRMVRLIITYVLVLSLITFGLVILMDYLAFLIGATVFAVLRYSIICAMPILLPYILFIAYCINEPFEAWGRRRSLRFAKERLDKANVLKIGITGSFGKTSVKEILKTMLSQKYRVLATPSSYNTPLGIAMTVRKLDDTHDVFIAEMGARSKGDIEQLAKLVQPKFGVLTGVNKQHLETFGNLETIKDTKFELFENLSEGGIGFFAVDNENSVELYEKFNGEKYLAGLSGNNCMVTATDVEISDKGMSFTLKIADEEPVQCTTVLLGRHSVKNICLAVAVAYKVGLSVKEILGGINRLQSIGHRLELMPNNKNIIVIDDSYNANVDGVYAAMEVLDTFKGRKIVLTPGLVEMGKEENLANLEMGKILARHTDNVIVIGKHNATMLINGLIEGGMNRENIKFAKNLNKGNDLLNEMLKEGDVVLFENDLPDNYN